MVRIYTMLYNISLQVHVTLGPFSGYATTSSGVQASEGWRPDLCLMLAHLDPPYFPIPYRPQLTTVRHRLHIQFPWDVVCFPYPALLG